MSIKVIVFDFDGTLVDSNHLKYETFFKLFPDDRFHHAIVQDILAEFPEESRFIVIEKMLQCASRDKKTTCEETVQKLVNQYGCLVLSAVKRCREMPGASDLLKTLSRICALYVSSTTPEEALMEIVADRGWARFFKGMYGYPNVKADTLKSILSIENCLPESLVVVGDGESDKISAESVGCGFFDVGHGERLLDLFNKLEHF